MDAMLALQRLLNQNRNRKRRSRDRCHFDRLHCCWYSVPSCLHDLLELHACDVLALSMAAAMVVVEGQRLFFKISKSKRKTQFLF